MLGRKSRTGARPTKGIQILNGNFFCWSCPSATFASQHGGFVPREWKAAKSLARRHGLRPGWKLATTENMIEKS